MKEDFEDLILEITSKDNLKIKNTSKLKQKKYREEFNRFVIENWKIIKENPSFCQEIFVTKSFFQKNEKDLLNLIKINSLKNIFLISEEIMKKMSSLENISGIIAVYKKNNYSINFDSSLLIYLNFIIDPGNLGTILRSALAFGIKNIILDEKCVDLYNEKTLNSCKGAIFNLNILIDKQENILKKLKQKNFSILITDVENGENLNNFTFQNKNICLVLGNESFGVDEKIRELANKKIIIPTTKSIESLNVSVSAGIIFYTIFLNKKF